MAKEYCKKKKYAEHPKLEKNEIIMHQKATHYKKIHLPSILRRP